MTQKRARMTPKPQSQPKPPDLPTLSATLSDGRPRFPTCASALGYLDRAAERRALGLQVGEALGLQVGEAPIWESGAASLAKKVAQPGKNVAQVGTIAPKMGSRSIVLPTPPTVNHAYATVNGRRVLSKEGKAYKAVVQGLLARAGWVPFEGPVAWTLEWRRERKSGDLSNRFKLVEDAMKGYAWGDDSQVVELRATRRDDPDHAGVTFTVEPR